MAGRNTAYEIERQERLAELESDSYLRSGLRRWNAPGSVGHGHPSVPRGESDAYGNQMAWPDQSIEPDQGWTNENDNSSYIHRDFDMIEVKRKVLPPPPKSLPAKPQPLVADVYRNDAVTLEEVDVNRTALPKTTAAPLEIKVSNNQEVAAPVTWHDAIIHTENKKDHEDECDLIAKTRRNLRRSGELTFW